MNKIYILLPVHNRCELTRKFINNLLGQTCQEYHLVVIDDGSTDGTAEMVAEICPNATILTGDGNWWWAGSLQRGYEWLAAEQPTPTDVVLLINDDTEFDASFFEKALEVLSKNHNALLFAMACGKNSAEKTDCGVSVNWKRLWLPQAKCPEEADCFSTRGLFLQVSAFFRIGGFHPILLPHYLSDYEYTLRARRKGYRIVTDESVTLQTKENEPIQANYEAPTLRLFLKDLFSVNSRVNPLMWSSFVALSAPWYWKFYSLCLVWCNALLTVVKYVAYAKRK